MNVHVHKSARATSSLWVTALVLVLLAACAAVPGKAAAAFQIERFGVAARDSGGAQVTQAGAHPDLVNEFEINSGPDGRPAADLKDIEVDLPAGMIINPSVLGQCSVAGVAGLSATGEFAVCPGSSQAGIMTLLLNYGFGIFGANVPLYNVDAGGEAKPRFSANLAGVIVNVEASVRTGDDYGITAISADSSQTLPLQGASVTLWGVPADQSHDAQRVCNVNGQIDEDCSAGVPRRPLVSYPSRCEGGPLEFRARVSSWQDPGEQTAATTTDLGSNEFKVTGCDQVSFDPDLELSPETRTAATPTGSEVRIAVPQSGDPDGLSTGLVKTAKVILPPGMTLNSTSAAGLVGCSPAQIGIDNASDPSCPRASKLGTVEIDSPLVENPLKGSVYLATQGDNPFNSLVALYAVAQGYQQTIKLAGEVTPDPKTGQLTIVFDENPQLPFETLRMRLSGGERAVLVTPSACGTYATRAELSSWAKPSEPVVSESSFTIDQGCGGNRFAPGFEAGTTKPDAGADSPFVLRVTRSAGEPNLSRIEATLPKGLLAKLAGVSLCGDAQAATGACPASSQVGKVTVGTGAGSNPLYIPEPGKAPTALYLSGPYQGAPLSLVAKVPAQAGPFDLGDVIVRNALHVDPVTTEVTTKSDPLPQILQGIPISYRDVRVGVDRPGFTINPTSCERMQVAGRLASATGGSATVVDGFKVTNCAALGFKPKLALRLSGAPPRRGGYPKLTATLTMPRGGANIRKAVVTMPETEFLENAHIRTVCTRVQYAADNCPKGSVYGYAKAWTPLLDKPLQGPVYLRSSNHTLPDLVASLDGQIHIDLAGRIDSANSRLRSTFWAVPDAPVSKFRLTMAGGRKGLLANNTNLCASTPRADAQFTGHNAKVANSSPKVKVTGCGKKQRK